MNRHIISENASLLDALAMLNALSGEVMTLFAVNSDGVMTGTLTDGDIRRGLLAGALPASRVSEVMFRDFKALYGHGDEIARLRDYRERGLCLIPRLNPDGTIRSIIDTTRTNSLLPLSAIIMAGGKGERLRPMTLTTPKPLLEIGGKAIIDYNIESLARVGITDITVTVNYLADKVEDHFATPVAGVRVKCVKESMPLGTIGAASLLKHRPGGITLVMNSDLLTTISFEDMYLKHVAEKADITIGAIPYNLSVPYAILANDGTCVTGIEEKPSYSYYANAGIYLISNDLLSTLPSDARTDATDLIADAIEAGRKVIYFPISGTWIDIGTPTDFKHAQELMTHHSQMSK